MRLRDLPSIPLLLLLACGPAKGGDDTGATATDTTTEPSSTTDTPTSTGSTTDVDPTGVDTGPMNDGIAPQATGWEIVVDDLPFPLADIHKVTFGRKEFDNNFANRGDVEVLFDQDLEVITIEIRKYDFTDSVTAWGDENSPGTFARMSPWAYNVGTASPSKPTETDQNNPDVNCLLEAWKDNCALYLYYDGLSQPVRSGADFRVHLPKAYRGELNVQTEDNDAEATYPRHGDVTITGTDDAGWCGSGTVKLSAGVARVRMCRDLVPAPTCPADQLAACETAGWDPACGCPFELLGQTRIESLKPWAADITVDMPDTVWLNATAANQSDAKPHECKPTISNCTGACRSHSRPSSAAIRRSSIRAA